MTVKVVPLPFSLCTSMVPFISSTMLLVMGMPRPELPHRLVEEESSWEKGSKSFGRYSLLMPMPVSLMVKRSVTLRSNRAVSSMTKVTVPPAGVNLTALPKILISSWRSFMSSPI